MVQSGAAELHVAPVQQAVAASQRCKRVAGAARWAEPTRAAPSDCTHRAVSHIRRRGRPRETVLCCSLLHCKAGVSCWQLAWHELGPHLLGKLIQHRAQAEGGQAEAGILRGERPRLPQLPQACQHRPAAAQTCPVCVKGSAGKVLMKSSSRRCYLTTICPYCCLCEHTQAACACTLQEWQQTYIGILAAPATAAAASTAAGFATLLAAAKLSATPSQGNMNTPEVGRVRWALVLAAQEPEVANHPGHSPCQAAALCCSRLQCSAHVYRVAAIIGAALLDCMRRQQSRQFRKRGRLEADALPYLCTRQQ